MKIAHYSGIDSQAVEESGASGVTIRWLITPDDGPTAFCMRHFDIVPSGYTPEHQHDWEHQVFILEGEGTVLGGDQTRAFRAGDVIFLPPNERHQFRNTGEAAVRLLCLVPAPKK